MKILVINCGSSSLKYQLIDMNDESVIAKGLCERIGIAGSMLTHSPAGKGKVVIENNYFNTSGCAILFQSDGEFWFESGGVYDVEIRNNLFDSCRYSPWGNAIIDCTPRPAEEDDRYFHKKIAVRDNRFVMINEPVVLFNNVEHAIFENNQIESPDTFVPHLTVQHVKNKEIKHDLPIKH